MDKIAAALKKNSKKSFIPYIMAGDGGIEILIERLVFLQECGCDAIEIGIPFSDPVADGPTIQRAGARALNGGTSLRKVLETLAEAKDEIEIPLILMTYLNPLVAYGLERFAADAGAAGVSGVIIPDLPLEEEGLVQPSFESNGLSLIRLVTLTTPEERIREIAQNAQGFLYAVTVTGITGSRKEFNRELAGFLAAVKKESPIPVLAGFGVSSAAHVEQVGKHCDGVIVGSRIIDLFEEGNVDEIRKLIQSANSIHV